MNVLLRRLRASCALALALVIVAGAASASAGTPFTGLTGSTSSTTVTTTTTSQTTAAPVTIQTTTTGGGLSTLDDLGIGLVALALFATIVYVIRRDAHSHAPRNALREIDRERGTVAPRTERIKRQRAKAKAARRARRAGR
jgi:hypothetical protein